ncbi:hypothetical protein BU23DRAFT_550090 [Bimuria novae-zelandiae CBS 107.79]|uniref:Uncharacterized protein n=1 Tax=Bimuria novae-zelandiae CBS 107.79 TaxID=1447943 RepID=A0A6A5VQ54_9PLEO|nr:hypothetical protein BU23DRAFT_550090 [Bimuria novae-zelandiae CBS 107.79]
MDDSPRSTVGIRELSNTSSIAASSSHPNPPSPSLSKSSSESIRNSCEAPRSPRTALKGDSSSLTSFPPPDDYTRIMGFDHGAPPTCREEDFGAKSKKEVRRMRMRDYAVEVSRLMGRQLVKSLNGKS